MTSNREQEGVIAPSPMIVVMFSSYGDAWTRTSVMANVGAVLAQQGHRVACTSLTAQSYLMDQLLTGAGDAEVRQLRQRPGLFDLLFEYTEALLSAPYDPQAGVPAAPDEESMLLGTLRLRRPSSCLTRAPIAASGGEPLFVLRGGPRALGIRANADSAWDRMNWAELRWRWGGDLYFEWMKHDLGDRVDLLFVDCDPGGDGHDAVVMLATSAADTLVMLSDYSNEQTAPAYHFLADITGIDVGLNRPHPASILPVPAGIESAELELLARGQDGFAFNFAKFLPEGCDLNLLREYEIPQTPPNYRLASQVLAWNRTEPQRVALVEPYARLADAILRTHQRARAPLAVEILSQRLADLPGRHNWDVFVSYSTNDHDIALTLRRRLVDSGLRPFVAQYDLAAQIGSSEWLAAIRRVLSRSRVLVALVTASAQKSEWVAQGVPRVRCAGAGPGTRHPDPRVSAACDTTRTGFTAQPLPGDRLPQRSDRGSSGAGDRPRPWRPPPVSGQSPDTDASKVQGVGFHWQTRHRIHPPSNK